MTVPRESTPRPSVADLPPWARESLLVQHSTRIHSKVRSHWEQENQKAGHDVGWERARVNWLIRNCLTD